MEKRLICIAKLEGNKTNGIPKDYLEIKAEERKKSKISRIKKAYETAEQESRRLITQQSQENFFSILENSTQESDREDLLLLEQRKKEDLLQRLFSMANEEDEDNED